MNTPEIEQLNAWLAAVLYIVACEACGLQLYIEAAAEENETHWRCPECGVWTKKEEPTCE